MHIVPWVVFIVVIVVLVVTALIIRSATDDVKNDY